MKIQHNDYTPDSTYFRTGAVEPDIDQAEQTITIYSGDGTRRSWGRPGTTSTIVLDDDDIVAIHVGFHHKHGGGQFWRYYTTDGTTICQITWATLPDQTRERILAAYEAKAPGWAKQPGKLRTEYRKASTLTRTAYKLVRMDGGRMVSLYDGETEYRIGQRLASAVRAQVDHWTGELTHDGGYYSQPTPDQVKALFHAGALVPADCIHPGMALALVECQIGGKVVQYPNGKLCSTYIMPMAVIETLTA